MGIRRRLMRAGPLVLPLAVGGALALVLIFRWGGEGAVRTVDSLTLVASSIYATVFAVLAARSAQGGSRRAWTTLSVALAAGTIGNAISAIRVNCAGDHHFSVVAGLLVSGVHDADGSGMTIFPTGPSRGTRLRGVLDGVTAALCLFLLMWIAELTQRVRQLHRGSRRTGSEGALFDRRPDGTDHGAAGHRACRTAISTRAVVDNCRDSVVNGH